MPTESAKKEHAKLLGVKGCYPSMKLSYHNRAEQSFIDGMHTVKVIIVESHQCFTITHSQQTFEQLFA